MRTPPPNLSLANVGVNKAPTPAVSDDPRFDQPHYPLELRQRWKDWVCAKMRDLQLTQTALAETADIDASYVWMVRRGYIPRRKVVAQIGRALGDRDGALSLVGMLLSPEQPDQGFALTAGALELLQLLSLVPPEEQDRAIKTTLPAVRKYLASRPIEQEAAAC